MVLNSGRNYKYSVLVLGFTALMTQIIVLREFLNVFHGNELVIGLVLSNWMLLTGTGAWIGRLFSASERHLRFLIIFQVLLAILPLITVFEIGFIREFFFHYGKVIGIIQSWFIIFISLLPFCFVSGILFPLFSQELSERYSSNIIGKVYAYDAIGSITGGLLFNLVLIYLIDPYKSLLILLLINIMAVFITLWLNGRKSYAFFLSGGSIALFLLILIINPGKIMDKLSYKGQEVLESKNTPFGKLVVTRSGEQLNFFENGVPLFSTGDAIQREEAVHYAMLQHKNPEKVLLISGGISGTIDEILKYRVKQIDYLEIDPWLIHLGKKYIEPLDDPRVKIITQDSRLFLKKPGEFYDVILVNVPDPASAELNRYYTLDYFRILKSHLADRGIVSISLNTTGNYLSEESRNLHSVLYTTLHKVFSNVRIIPGYRDYFIASEQNLNMNLNEAIANKGIKNEYVNPYYLNEELINQRSAAILNSLDTSAKVNSDFKPVTYYQYLKYWLSQFQFRLWIIPIILGIITLLCFFILGPVNLGLFISGFSAGSVEFLLLILFQVIYGYVYQMTGIIVSCFMGGLAVGSMYRSFFVKQSNFKNFLIIQSVMAGYTFLIPLFMILLNRYSSYTALSIILIFILTAITGIIVGVQYSMATHLMTEKIIRTASKTYSADLLGSAIGALLISIFIMPVLGLISAAILIGALNVLAIFTMFLRGKKYIPL